MTIELTDKQLYRPDEVAEILKVNRQTVYNWCEEGKLKSYKIGGVLRIDGESILKIMQKKEGP